MVLYSSVHGNNSLLIKQVSDFYIKDGQRVADVTFGKGIFWKDTDLSRFDFKGTDISIKPFVDFKDLPYGDTVVDHVILDPPYMHNPGNPIVKSYRNKETHGVGQGTMYHNDILDDYYKGMVEAFRVLKTGGMLWVKCKDEIESGRQRWSHVEIYIIAKDIGFIGKDLFVLTPLSSTPLRHKRQLHSKKNHSYLWIFLKLDRDKFMKLKSKGIDYDSGKSK